MDQFLRNAWYVGAWAEELDEKPLGRTLLGEAIVFYRKADGGVAALQDRCPHRFVPLSLGKVKGDRIQCGYHGLCFDADGTCVDERFNDHIRSASQLKSYPVVERHSAIWIWMGDAEAQPELIPDFAFLDDKRFDVIRGRTPIQANYTLEIDNLMDLSHLDYLHLATIGNGSLSVGEYKAWQDGDEVHSDWWSPGCETPRQFLAYVDNAPVVDQWTDMRWNAPASVYLYNGVTRVGCPREEGYPVHQGHFATPETATSTHYFWSVARPDLGEPPQVREFVEAVTRRTFETEDTPMLEAQQRAMKSLDFWAERPVIFPEDSGAIRARRVLDKLIREEQRQNPVAEPAA